MNREVTLDEAAAILDRLDNKRAARSRRTARRRTQRRTEEHRPLRTVTASREVEGRGGLLGPDTIRRLRWYELDLDCGHTVERNARYIPIAESTIGKFNGMRRYADMLPPPVHARCDTCESIARAAARAAATTEETTMTTPTNPNAGTKAPEHGRTLPVANAMECLDCGTYEEIVDTDFTECPDDETHAVEPLHVTKTALGYDNDDDHWNSGREQFEYPAAERFSL